MKSFHMLEPDPRVKVKGWKADQGESFAIMFHLKRYKKYGNRDKRIEFKGNPNKCSVVSTGGSLKRP